MAGGPAGFTQDSSCPALLRILHIHQPGYVYGIITLFDVAFQPTSTSPINEYTCSPTTPVGPKPHRFGLFPFRSPLLRESLLFSPPPGTKMFQFPGLASLHKEGYPLSGMGCPIRKSAAHQSFASPRGLSQLSTSFIASESLGIHRMPLS